MATDCALRNAPMPSQPGLKGKGLVVVGARRLLLQRRHELALRQEIYEPACAVHVFDGKTVGPSAAGTTASMPSKAANRILVDLRDSDLPAFQPLPKMTG